MKLLPAYLLVLLIYPTCFLYCLAREIPVSGWAGDQGRAASPDMSVILGRCVPGAGRHDQPAT